jgi:hypothetical protein
MHRVRSRVHFAAFIGFAGALLMSLPGRAVRAEGAARLQSQGSLDFGEAAQWETGKAPARDSGTQMMMIDRLDLDTPGMRGAEAHGNPPAIHAMSAPMWLSLAQPRFGPPHSILDLAGFWLYPFRVQDATRTARVHAYLTSLGTSTGEAFDIQIVNDGTEPVHISGEGIVVEPIKKGSEKDLRAALARAPTPAPAIKANGYCLEFNLKPPEAGLMFRVSDAATQRQYAPTREILLASSRLRDAGTLQPDSAPADYFHAIRQWAVWTNQEKFTLDSYRQAFIARSKKNAEALGRKWNDQLEQGLAALAPHRWDEITKILKEAGQPVPSAK